MTTSGRDFNPIFNMDDEKRPSLQEIDVHQFRHHLVREIGYRAEVTLTSRFWRKLVQCKLDTLCVIMAHQSHDEIHAITSTPFG